MIDAMRDLTIDELESVGGGDGMAGAGAGVGALGRGVGDILAGTQCKTIWEMSLIPGGQAKPVMHCPLKLKHQSRFATV